MTQEQFNAMMESWLEARAKEQPGDWSEEDRKWAEGNGIVTGDEGGKRYKSFITREEAAAMMHRAAKL